MAKRPGNGGISGVFGVIATNLIPATCFNAAARREFPMEALGTDRVRGGFQVE
jgi:hypothetical protein